MQITKSINGMEPKKPGGKASDTMGMKHFVEFGTYMVQGAVPRGQRDVQHGRGDAGIIDEFLL